SGRASGCRGLRRLLGRMGFAGRHAGRGFEPGPRNAMIVRPYEPAAFDGVVKLWQETGILVSYNDPKIEIPRLLANGNCQLYIGTEDERVVGSVLVGHDGYRGWIYKLAVAADCRKRGYGKQLVNLAENWLVARGIPKCNLMVRATNPEAL